MKLDPKGKHVLLEIVTRADQLADEVKNRSGLLVTTAKTRQGEPNTGIVYAIGADVPDDRLYHVGDTVVFHSKEIFQGFHFDGKKLVSVEHEEILAIIESPA